MPQDWYATVADVADRLAYTAKSSYAHIHDSLSDLTSGIDSAVFHATGPTKLFAPAPPPPSQWETISAWIVENKYAIAALTGVTGAGAYIVYKQQVRKHKKRRAARTGNASRKEVLIITNFTTNALSRLVAFDLERRGFIVFCACASSMQKGSIENEGHADIRPLMIGKGADAYRALESFGSFLSIPAPAYHGGHTLHFAGLILTPPANLPTGPLEIIDTAQMAQAIDSGLTHHTTMLQYFLPLLREHSGRIVFLNDWILPSLHTPFYVPQVVAAHATRALAKTIGREVPSLFSIHMKLGTFDIAQYYHSGTNPQRTASTMRADILNWSPSLRAAYSANLRSSTKTSVTTRVRGSPLKELHHAVFDALTDASPAREISVGAGVDLYERIAAWTPEIGLRWLLGVGVNCGDDDWEVLDQ